MPQQTKIRLTDRDVRDAALARLRQSIPLSVAGYACTTDMIWDVLLRAAATRSTVEGTSQDLAGVADSNTILGYVNQQLAADRLAELERQINAALVAQLPAHVWRQACEIACDLHDEPFYGKTPELLAYACRGAARAGTTYFYRVATAYVIADGVRFTLAVLFVQPQDTVAQLLASLLRRLRIVGLSVRRLYLDKGFCTIPVLRTLADSPWPVIIACPVRGKTGGTKALCHGRGSYRTQHTFRSAEHGEFTAELAVIRTRTTHKRRKQRPGHCCWLIYVVLRCADLALRKVHRVYRRRFGIESSYRCVRKVRAWTTSRNPALRFLLIALGFLLVNLWQELRCRFCQVIRQRHRYLDADRFQLQRLASFLSRAIEAISGVCSFIEADVRSPPVKSVIY
jgi:putative transposase